MSSKSLLFAGIAGAVAIAISAITYYFFIEDGGDDDVKYDPQNWDYSDKPPELKFNSRDSDFCRENVEELHEWAMNTYEGGIRNEEKLNGSYEAILSR